MFKKKEKIVDTPTDILLKEKNLQLFDFYINLKNTAKDVIVANGVIELYPEGADKEKARKIAEEKKLIMLSLINEYNNLKNQLNKLLDREDRNTTKGEEWTKYTKTSHEIIEKAYKEFYKKA